MDGMLRRALVLALAAMVAIGAQLVGATGASAATSCRHYDQFGGTGGTILRNVNICAAPASDFPRYSGWGRAVHRFSTVSSVCGWTLFPMDIDELPDHGAMPGPTCAPEAPYTIQAWRWTGRSWTHVGVSNGEQVYVAPYAAGWRWIWTQRTGWLALAEGNIAFRWSA